MRLKPHLNILIDIPREIRDEIYEYAFQTPFNCVTYRCTLNNTYKILPYDPQNDICLSNSSLPALGLLSTCSQLYNEAIVSLWKVNSLGIWPADLLFRMGDLGDDTFIHIQSLQVNLDLTDSDDLKWAEMLFLSIGGNYGLRDERTEGGKWSGLKKVQINPMRTEEIKMDVKWMQRVSEAMDMRWKSEELFAGMNPNADKRWGLYSRWMKLLRKAGTPGNDIYLGDGIKRAVCVNTAWDDWVYWDQNEWLKKSPHGAGVKEMEEVMEDFSDTFGGELWANGKLCYKDKERLKRVFELKPVELLGIYSATSE
ncbi:uncharacterized protein EAE98_010485 [Botrytis deweyae]|uniref:F-box domain-containing protein n=2 Tax=Botrytis TaxID=33196 RepID=A0A4Z1KCQ2_9HELO|nr:uncharacterized protein EAE98_010485 [Botrytis deweyae]KAF7916147.1 hypothetical protein EAE99_009900 [Botrytis elliptica]KAF7916763.1 hypothetical protein EAE98_010485 [Botrytis deweyae]TGO78983.1 hypothetical protein BELL_0047g00060 [Botrytis elliptica]